ncbi:aldehyde dehydrogenase family protein [Anaerococcus sp. mt242]|uniref:aldehyde dehydrogenase family protein n=1 Tax=Anaerococcus sp. mt242 TaxID=2661917 RepID=UPI00193125D5|nr:aldehyde dehydrogenase family protein [Anaerococcus sp. mt242]MBM0046453.1 aldehyde dehydrogenase family protein [Anaerococcus sp. mt242]
MNLENLNNEKLYINGEYIDSTSGEFIDVENPATEEIFAKIPSANEEDINKAVDAAYEAFKTWSKTPLSERVDLVKKLNQWIDAHQDDFDKLILLELGIPIHVGHGSQVGRQVDRTNVFIEQVENIDLETPMEGGILVREPIGVVASITPWNYPLGQIIQKVIPALLSGCTVVQKPATITPLSAYLLTKGIDEVGFPKGVFNLVTGQGSEVGDILNKHPKVAMISYTGSLAGGAASAKAGMDTATKVVLELGGKSPAVFVKGANIKEAVEQVLGTVYKNIGQTCSCLSRAVLTEDIYDEVLEEFLKQYENFPVGDPTDENTVVGPLSSKKQFERVKGYIEKGIEEGAELIRGEVPNKDGTGYYVKPAIFTNVKPGMKIHDEEIFGPVLSIIKVKDVEEAIEVANSVDYGLSSAVFGENDKALEIAKQIYAGECYVNTSTKGPNLPFGGYKQSGIGREGGLYGLLEYYELKSIYTK